MATHEAQLRQALEVERHRAVEQIEALTLEYEGIVASVETDVPDDEHDPEGSTRGFERARVSSLLQAVREHLEALDQATARLEGEAGAGVYGRCEQCGQEIGLDRLVAQPTARSCIRCASRPHEQGIRRRAGPGRPGTQARES